MAGPFGVSPGVSGNYAYRAAPSGTIQQRPLPVPLVQPTTVPQRGIVTGGVRPMPGLQAPSPLGGFTPTRPTVLVPNTQPGTPAGTVTGVRPVPTGTYPTTPTYPGTTYPDTTRPLPTGPQQGIMPSRTTPTQQPGSQCGMFTNWGLIGFFDKTVGAAVKSLLGMRDSCTPGQPNTGLVNGVAPYSIAPNQSVAPYSMTTPQGLQMSPRSFR